MSSMPTEATPVSDTGRLTPAPRWKQVTLALLVVSCCILALGARVRARYGESGGLYYGNSTTGMPRSDAKCFSIHARHLVEGRGFGMYMKGFRFRNFVPPGHPFFLGAGYMFLGNNALAIGWMIALCSSLLPLFVYLLSREMWGRPVGIVTALLVAVYPTYVNLGFTMMSEPTAILTSALSLWLWARFMRTRDILGGVLAGLMFGAAVLVRPAALALLVGMFPWFFVVELKSWRRNAVLAAVFLAVFSVLPSAWLIRTRVVHEQPGMSYSAISARHAWTGANPDYGPDFYSRGSQHHILWRDPEASEIERVLRLKRETKVFVRENRLWHAFGCLWRMTKLKESRAPRLHKEIGATFSYSTMGLIATCLLWTLGTVGGLRGLRAQTVTSWRQQRRVIPGWVWVGGAICVLLVSVIGVGIYGAHDRYRWPLELILFPFAGLAIVSLCRLATHDLSGRWTLDTTLPAPTRIQRLAVLLPTLLVVSLLAVYALLLAFRYCHPRTDVLDAPILSSQQVEQAIAQSGLMPEFDAQKQRWISYEDVLADQARNYGDVVEHRDKLAVWSGRIMYPQYNAHGQLTQASFIVNPSDTDFGGTLMPMICSQACSLSAGRVEDGDIITIITRVRFIPRPKTVPTLEVHAMLRGRFPLPVPGE